MKAAVTFFFVVMVFTTIFIESSAVPVDSGLITKGLRGDGILKDLPSELIINGIPRSEAALAEVREVAEDALSKATGVEKVVLADFVNYLKELDAVFRVLHPDVLAAVASGTKKDLGNVIPRLSSAMEQATAEGAKYVLLLGATPGLQTTRVEVVFVPNFTLIGSNAVLGLKALRVLESTASS